MYTPISRKYRPSNFDEIIGQEHITTTLKNAVKMDKASYAYLFSGSQGVGKTSTARVFAKALNCEKGPTPNPCGKCVACQEIAKSISMDVLEIDGASNRGIEEIRNLRENVKLKPIAGKYKIYIIDEVHMLTPEAFNALLKTLEEPPPHVKFIFATTKPYKVLPTILSRCQRFDFHAIPLDIITAKLKEIASSEKIDIEEAAAALIAKNAEGSLRDAEMMLDQIASFSKDKIKEKDVSGALGLIDKSALDEITDNINKRDSGKIIDTLDNLINSGRDAYFITESLIGYFRDLLVRAVSAKGAASEKGAFSRDELLYMIFTLAAALESIGKTSLGRIPLEMALLKLASKEKIMPFDELIRRLDSLEHYVKSSSLPAHNEAPLDYGPVMVDEPETADTEGGITVPLSGDAVFLRLKGIWPEIIRGVKNRKMSAGIYLEEGELLSLDDNKIIVGFQKSNSLHKEALESKQNTDIIVQVIKELIDKDLNISYVLTNSNNHKPQAAVQPSPDIDVNPAAAQPKKIEPIIKSALDKFNAKIIKQYYIKEKDK